MPIYINKLILFFKNKWIQLLMFFLCIFIAFGIVTYFTGNLKVEEDFGFVGCYFDALGTSMIGGKLDVPPKYIGGEAFINNGKFYGYFGLFPAVIRIGLNGIFPSMFCKWSRIIVLVFYLLSLFVSFKFYSEFKSKGKSYLFPDCLYILVIGLGSSLLFLTSKSFIYHESIIIAVCCSLLSYYFLFNFITNGKEKNFLLSVVFAFFSIHTRVNVGLGNIVSLGLYTLICLIYLVKPPRKIVDKFKFFLPYRFKISKIRINILIIIALYIVTVTTLCGVNYIKFGNYLSFTPFDKHIAFLTSPNRMANMKKYYNGSLLSLSNVIHNAEYYFGVGGLEFIPTFPYLFSQAKRSWILQLNSIDLIEYNVSLLYSIPLMYLSTFIGLIFVFTKKKYAVVRLLVLGSLVTIFLTLAAINVSQRYIHDLFPFIVITGTIGFIHIYEKINKKIYLKIILLVFTIISLYINFSITIWYQRKINVSFDKTMENFISQSGLIKTIFNSQVVVFQHAPGNVRVKINKPNGAKYFMLKPIMDPKAFGKGNGVEFIARFFIGGQLFEENKIILDSSNDSQDTKMREFIFGPFPNRQRSYEVELQLITDPRGNNAYDWSGWTGFKWNNNKNWLNDKINELLQIK